MRVERRPDVSDVRRVRETFASVNIGLKHEVFAEKYKVGAVSAVKVLELAIEQEKGVYDIDEGNLEEQLALMDLPYWAENQIRDHVEGGYRAKAPGGVVSQDEWSGVGYVFWKEGGGNN